MNHTNSDRVSGWEWSETALLVANLGWTTLCLGGYMAKTMVVTSALTGALLIVHAAGCLFRNTGGSVADPKPPAVRVPGPGPVAPHRAGWLFVPFLLYASANVISISPVRWLGWFDWIEWVLLVSVFWVVLNGIRHRRPQQLLIGTLLALGAVGVFLECYQRFVDHRWLMLGRTQVDQYLARSGGFVGNPNTMGGFLILILPACGAIAFRRRAAAPSRVFFGWLTLVLLFGLGLTISRGAWLGLLAALAVWPLLRAGVSWKRRLLWMSGVLGVALLLGSVAFVSSISVRERLVALVRDAGERSRPILWRACAQIVRDHPLVGSGGGSFNTLFERYRPEGFVPVPLWAHNDYLNTLSDYGAVGFILFFGAAGLVIWRCLAHRRAARLSIPSGGGSPDGSQHGRLRAGGLDLATSGWLDDPFVQEGLGIGVLAFGFQLLVEFHLKIPALAMAVSTVAGILVGRSWIPDRNRHPSACEGSLASRPHVSESGTVWVRWMASILVGSAGITMTTGFIPRFRAEALRAHGREVIDRLYDPARAGSGTVTERLQRARDELARAVALAPDNAQAWSDSAYGAAQRSRLKPADSIALGRVAERDADRALALCPLISEFWIRRGVAKDMEGEWAQAGLDFAHAAELSPNSVLPWYHYAYHLSLRPATRDFAAEMAAFCLRLDPSNREAQALRHRLANSGTVP